MPKPAPTARKGNVLTRKAGPFPAWLWAVLVIVAYLLFSRLTAGAATSTESTAVPVSSDTSGADSGAQQPAGGAGSPADNFNADLIGELYGTNAATIDTLTNALLTQRAIDAAPVENGGPPGSSSPNGVAAKPVDTTAIVTSAAGHLTQNVGSALQWGGKTFTTKAGFDLWAKQHGTTAGKELANHPQALTIYNSLR